MKLTLAQIQLIQKIARELEPFTREERNEILKILDSANWME
jgi:hypothetical protein